MSPSMNCGFVLPFFDSFTRPDGTKGRRWRGSTWGVSSNAMVNTPTLGNELLVDGGLEVWTSPTNLTNWTETIAGSSTVNQESSIIHGGTYASRADIDASNSNGNISQVINGFGIGNWAKVTFWHRTSASGKYGKSRFSSIDGVTRDPGTTWTQYTDDYRSTQLNPSPLFGVVSAASASLYFDDLSLKQITFTSCLATLPSCISDVTAQVIISGIKSGTFAGLVLNLDDADNPQNFILAYVLGSKAYLDKCVNGTYTNLVNGSITFGAAKVLKVIKIGDVYQLIYDGTQIGSNQTVTNMNGEIHGLFSTDSNNKFINYSLIPSTPIPDPPSDWGAPVWVDDFDGTEVDTSKWWLANSGGWGSGTELQYYRPENATVASSILTILVDDDGYGGYAYTSARLETARIDDKSNHKAYWRYGRFEIRAKMPKTKGIWPIVWIFPIYRVYGYWPLSGEIDIAELRGSIPQTVNMNFHSGNPYMQKPTGYTLPSGDFSDDFHIFALEWEPNVLRWYVDGVLRKEETNWYSSKAYFPTPFNQNFGVILNVAVGGTYDGDPDETTVFPQTMQVDYVKVYQR